MVRDRSRGGLRDQASGMNGQGPKVVRGSNAIIQGR